MSLETPGSEFKGQHMVERAQGFAQNAGPSAYHQSGPIQRPSCVHCHDGCVCGRPGDDASHVEGSTRTVNEKELDNRMQAGKLPAYSDHLPYEFSLDLLATSLATFVAAMGAPQGPECQVLPAADVE